jgi:hypothetical protein
VALGFEHCIANLYLLPVAMLNGANIDSWGMLANIVPVTLGNTVGGAGIATAYWFIYLRQGFHEQQRVPGCAHELSRKPGGRLPTQLGFRRRPIWRVTSKGDTSSS